MVFFIPRDAGNVDASHEFAPSRIFLDPQRDKAAWIDPAPDSRINGYGRVIGLRFQNLTADAIDHVVTHDGLVFPAVNIFDRILVGKITSEQTIAHLRSGQSAHGLLRNNHETSWSFWQLLM